MQQFWYKWPQHTLNTKTTKNTNYLECENIRVLELISWTNWLLRIPSSVRCKKYRDFVRFPGVEILWKGTVSYSFGRIARNYAVTVPFYKISTLGNQVKLRYFLQWWVEYIILPLRFNKLLQLSQNFGVIPNFNSAIVMYSNHSRFV